MNMFTDCQAVTYVMECSFLCTAGHYTEGSKTAKIRHWKKLKWKLACTAGRSTPSRLVLLLTYNINNNNIIFIIK